MTDTNTVTLSGTVVNTPVLHETKSGVPVLNLTIEIYAPSGPAKLTRRDQFSVVVWKGLAEAAFKNLTAGSPVMLIGRLQNNSLTNKTEIMIDDKDAHRLFWSIS